VTRSTSALLRWWSIDEAYDRLRASDGLSRYGAYLADRLDQADTEDDLRDAATWTAWCWRVATPPVMRPGYVRQRDPIVETSLWRDPDGGGLAVTLVAASPLPPGLGSPWRTWHLTLLHDLAYGHPPRALARVEFEATLDPPTRGWVPPPQLPCSRDVLVAAATNAVRRATDALDVRFAQPLTVLAHGLGIRRGRGLDVGR